MDEMFSCMYNDGCLVYFDNIVLYANTIDELTNIFRRALSICVVNKLAIRLSKMKICEQFLPTLGHIVSEFGVCADPRKVEALRNCAIPKSKEELRSFLGTVGYLRRFIPHFSELALPLTELTRKSAIFA